jgi:hypothetical protein
MEKLMLNLHKNYIPILLLEIIIITRDYHYTEPRISKILQLCHHQEKEIYKTEIHFG